jgi:hypothetical protein
MATGERDEHVHDLRGTLNNLGLQLEVMGLAFARADAAMHERALEAARAAVAKAAQQIEALRGGGPT